MHRGISEPFPGKFLRVTPRKPVIGVSEGVLGTLVFEKRENSLKILEKYMIELMQELLKVS